MVDRLGDLGPIPRDVESGGGRGGATGRRGLEEPLAHAEHEMHDTQFMPDFFAEVGRIKAKMALMRRNIKLMEQKHQNALTAITMDQGKQISEEIDNANDETTKLAQEVRSMLKNMEEKTKRTDSDDGDAQVRIRKNMQGTLSRKFLELMKEYQDVQTKSKEKYKDRIVRQLHIVQPNATAAEVEQVLSSGNTSVFATPVLTQGQAAATHALAEIQEKHQDILKLERSLQELHQLFVDMSVLVETQGELLNQIEYSVEQSVQYTEKGVVELQKAGEYQKSARKKMCIIICCLVILFGVIALVVFGALGKL